MQRTAVGDRHPDGAGHLGLASQRSPALTRLPPRRVAPSGDWLGQALRGARPAVAPAVTTRNPVLVDSGLRPHGVRPRPRHSSRPKAHILEPPANLLRRPHGALTVRGPHAILGLPAIFPEILRAARCG